MGPAHLQTVIFPLLFDALLDDLLAWCALIIDFLLGSSPD
jgi:hypothetical protein